MHCCRTCVGSISRGIIPSPGGEETDEVSFMIPKENPSPKGQWVGAVPMPCGQVRSEGDNLERPLRV